MFSDGASPSIRRRRCVNPGFGVGHLSINGKLQEASSGALNFELASLADFDLLSVTGNVILGGTIAAVNAGYVPVIGDSFTVMTFNDRAGTTFAGNVLVNGFGSGTTFSVLYGADYVKLVVAAVPEPETWALLLAGLGLIGRAVRRARPM